MQTAPDAGGADQLPESTNNGDGGKPRRARKIVVSIALERTQLGQLDALAERLGGGSRSQAVRYLIVSEQQRRADALN